MPPRPELRSHPDALAEWRRRERTLFAEIFAPGPHLSPSEWAAQDRIISQGPARGHRWTNEAAPYLVEILDFVGAPWARRGVVRKSARVGYTEGVIGNALGWTVAMDPCPIAVVQPSDGEAKSYSKEQIAPMVELNPVISSRLGEMGVRSADTTITHKEFRGGFLSILGSASDKNMRRRSFKRMLVDEVDGMQTNSVEGDPILRLEKRTDDYADAGGVMLVGSTPTMKHLSRIDREFEKTDQRFWHVPCPHCAELQVLKWGGPETTFGMKWAREIACKGCGLVLDDAAVHCPACLKAEFHVRHLPEAAFYQCAHCGEAIDEDQKGDMVRAGRWIATNPGAAMPGWHIDALISLFPAARWGRLAAEFLAAIGNVGELQVFWNTVLGLAWEERSENVEVAALEGRAEEFTDAQGNVADVPDGVGVLTAFTDVQGSWLELLVRGWGLGEESWDILHERIPGDPDAASTWARLEGLLTKTYRHARGSQLRIMCALIDAGAYTDSVYRFVRPRESRLVFASLGDRSGAPEHVPLRPPSKANNAGVRVYTIGTFKMKAALFHRLALTQPGPRYMHLRAYNMARCNGFDAEYFRQFDAEQRVPRRSPGSRDMKWLFVKTRDRNEAIDLHVGNMAALQVLGAPVRERMAAFVEAARSGPQTVARHRRVLSKGVEV